VGRVDKKYSVCYHPKIKIICPIFLLDKKTIYPIIDKAQEHIAERANYSKE